MTRSIRFKTTNFYSNFIHYLKVYFSLFWITRRKRLTVLEYRTFQLNQRMLFLKSIIVCNPFICFFDSGYESIGDRYHNSFISQWSFGYAQNILQSP